MDEIVSVKKKKKKLPVVIGIIVFIFAIIGVVSTVIFVTDEIKSRTAVSEDYTAYADYLTWVVGIDPDPFTDITKANYDDLLNIAVCSLLSDEVKTGQYAVTEAGLTVPAADVEACFTKMFGADVKIVHASVVGYGYKFTYNAAANTYTVPLTGVTPPFAPRIESATHTGGLVYLRVGYVGTTNIEVGADGSINAAQPDKYMDITLKETDNGFNLVSIAAVTSGEY